MVQDVTPVVVLRCLPFPMHPGAIGVVRSFGRLGVPVHVVGMEAASPTARSRYLTGALPLEEGLDGERLVERLASLRLGRPAVLLPVDDVAALLVDEYAAKLHGDFLFPEPPPGLARTLVDKRELNRLAQSAGVPVPGSCSPSSFDEVERFLEHAAFPVVVKAGDPRLLHENPAATSVAILDTADDVRRCVERTATGGELNVLLQEYVPGGPENGWMINGYFDRDSVCRFAATGRKLRQWPAYTGATTLGVIERNDEVIEATCRLVEHVGYRGIVDIGFRYDQRDGQYKLLDVNPRIGATFRLFAAADGLDVARCLYLDLTGQPIPSSPVRDGRRWVVENRDPVSSAVYVRDGQLTVGEYLRSFRGTEEATWFARDDLRPFLHTCRVSLGQAVAEWRRHHELSATPERAPAALRVRRFDSVAEAEQVWTAVLERDRYARFFSRPEWLGAWWKHFGGSRELLLLGVYDGEQPVGLAPLMLGRSAGVPVVQLLGTGLSDYGDLLADDERGLREAVVTAVLDHLAAAYPDRVVDLQQLPDTSPTLGHLRAWLAAHGRRWHEYRQAECPYFELPSDVATFDGQLDKRVRKQERRRRTRLGELGEVSFIDMLEPPDGDWARLCAELADVERERDHEQGYRSHWKGDIGAFLQDVLAATAEGERHLLSGIRLDGRLISYSLRFVDRDVIYGYLRGFDLQYRPQGPGQLLLLHVHRLAIERGLRVLDHLRGMEPDKLKWSSGKRNNYRVAFTLGRSPRAWAGFTAHRLAASARVAAREVPALVTARQALRRRTGI